MSVAAKRTLLSVEEYLAMESDSTVKYEYVGGAVYAMTGARNAHHQIATNVVVAFGLRLRGTSCRPFNSDTKIRLRLPSQVRFYYPDASVICRPNPQSDPFQDEPSLLVEVVSRGTRRVDEGEKREAYLTIPSLSVYLLIEQDGPGVVAFRRTEHGFVREAYNGLDATVPLPELRTELPLADIYDGIEFVPSPSSPLTRPRQPHSRRQRRVAVPDRRRRRHLFVPSCPAWKNGCGAPERVPQTVEHVEPVSARPRANDDRVVLDMRLAGEPEAGEDVTEPARNSSVLQ